MKKVLQELFVRPYLSNGIKIHLDAALTIDVMVAICHSQVVDWRSRIDYRPSVC